MKTCAFLKPMYFKNGENWEREVFEEFRSSDENWARMAKDKFGNFVDQCALRVMKQRGMIQTLREFVEKVNHTSGRCRLGLGIILKSD